MMSYIQLSKFTIVLLVLLASCNKALYFHSQSHFPYPHGDSSYSEIQLHEDGTYEEFHYSSNIRYPDPEAFVYEGKYSFNSDTLEVKGFMWDFNVQDSTWFVWDSNRVMLRFLIKDKKLYQEEYPTGSGKFDSTLFDYEKGKLFKLRRIERRDSIVWINAGWHKPPGRPTEHHGLKEHQIGHD